MAVIKIPKTPAKAFNKDRPVSDLLKGQIEHLEWAIRPAAERGPSRMQAVRRRAPRTEGEAAARIEALTRQLHPDGAVVPPPASAAAIAPPADVVPSPGRKKAAQARTATKRRTTTRKTTKTRRRGPDSGPAAKSVTRRGRGK